MTQKDDDDIGAQVSSRLEEMFGEEDSDAAEETPQQAQPSGKQKAEPEEGGRAREKQPQEVPDTDFDDSDSPLKELKALVFGIDWEISDESMDSFLKEVKQLQQQYANDKILSTFLKLHESVGRYIQAKKARSHPDSIRFVTSVFTSFEKVLMTPDMPRGEKKRLLTEEIKKFKDFKEQVLSKRKPRKSEPAGDIAAEEENAPAAPAEAPEMAVPAAAEASSEKPEPAAPAEAPEAEAATEGTPAAVLQNQEVIDYIVAELKKTIQAEFHTVRQIIKNLGA